MNAALREKAIKLRTEQHLSYTEIRKRLGVPKSTLSYWLREYPLSDERILELRRAGWQKGEAAREKYRATMRKKKEERAQKVYEIQLKKIKKLNASAFFAAGLMLYLAEGEKNNHTRLALANTDPRVILFFISWLQEFFDTPRSKVRVHLHLYEGMDLEKERKFWQNTLSLQRSQFYKPYVSELKKGSFTYKESFRHGTCGLYVMGVERATEVFMAIKAFIDYSAERNAGV